MIASSGVRSARRAPWRRAGAQRAPRQARLRPAGAREVLERAIAPGGARASGRAAAPWRRGQEGREGRHHACERSFPSRPCDGRGALDEDGRRSIQPSEQAGCRRASGARPRARPRAAPTGAGGRSRSTRAGRTCSAAMRPSRSVSMRSKTDATGGRTAPAAACTSPAETGHTAEALPLPDEQRQARRHERDAEASSLPPAAREHERQHGADQEEVVGGFDAGCEPRQEPGEDGVVEAARPGSSAAHERGCREQQEHHRRVVGHLGEPQRLREELLDVALVVAVDEERDREIRRDDPNAAHQSPAARPAMRAASA